MRKIIQDKTRDLRQKNQAISKLLRQQSDFIAVTAHEFRTPLNIALLQLDDTLDSYEHSNQVLSDMKVLEASLSKLKELTQNLFDVQQYDLEKAQLNAEETSIKSFVLDICSEAKDIVKSHSLHLTSEVNLNDSLRVKIDKTKIRQVLHNLISNAQKFTPEGGSVGIKSSTNGNSVMIEVSDTGIGIPDEEKERIFEKFQTADAKKGMGIGMGLYLCKKIMELHHGEIHLRDNEPVGSVFTISLPIAGEAVSGNQ